MSHQRFLEALFEAAGRAPVDRSSIERLYIEHYNPVSGMLLREAKRRGTKALGNDNISALMAELGITVDDLQPEVEAAFGEVLGTLGVNWRDDHNSEGTPKRYAKMTLRETLNGRYEPAPRITDFPNVSNANQLIVVKGIRVESLCSHHHQNIRGRASVGVLPRPGGKVIGLSKFSRIVQWFARRPQIQEELTVQIADFIDHTIRPRGVAVLIEAEHQCMSVRGVCEPGASTNTIHLLGEFLEADNLRDEFYRNVRA